MFKALEDNNAKVERNKASRKKAELKRERNRALRSNNNNNNIVNKPRRVSLSAPIVVVAVVVV